jgi:chaperone required for assembly of F1-ATPase
MLISSIKNINYQQASLKDKNGTYVLSLDEELLLSESGKDFGLSNHSFMLQLLEEWQSRIACDDSAKTLDLRLMPYSRMVGAWLDFEAKNRSILQQNIIEYASGDALLIYDPNNAQLLAEQTKTYINILRQIELALNIKYHVSYEIMPKNQEERTINNINNWLQQSPNEIFLVNYILTQTLSSFALSFALINKMITSEEAINAGWLEYNLQMAKWGNDDELIAKRQQDFTTVKAAMLFLQTDLSERFVSW